jgi:hypothetical protein
MKDQQKIINLHQTAQIKGLYFSGVYNKIFNNNYKVPVINDWFERSIHTFLSKVMHSQMEKRMKICEI